MLLDLGGIKVKKFDLKKYIEVYKLTCGLIKEEDVSKIVDF